MGGGIQQKQRHGITGRREIVYGGIIPRFIQFMRRTLFLIIFLLPTKDLHLCLARLKCAGAYS